MKEGWKYQTLGEIVSFSRGLTYSKRDEVELSRNIVLRSNNVDLDSGKLILEELKYISDSIVIPADKIIKKGSLLICMSNGSKNHLGKVALVREELDYAFGGFMGMITPSDFMDSAFLYYALTAPNYKQFIKSLSAGANINNIKVKDLGMFKIPVPPLPEQQRIVTYLDTAFAKIDAIKANAEKNLDDAKALFQAALLELLTPGEGWRELKMKEVCESIKDGSHNPPSGTSKSNYIMLSSQNIMYGSIDTNLVRYLSQENFEIENRRTNIKKGDILLTIVGTIGRCCVFQSEEHVTFQRSVAVLKPKSLINSYYLMYYIWSINTELNDKAHGAAQKGLYLKQLADISVSVPSLHEQQQIVNSLNLVFSKIEVLQSNLRDIQRNCHSLKQSLLKQVFEQ